MEITYQILLDELPVRLIDYSGGKNREFKSVEMYSGDSSVLSGSTLYIADLKTACALSWDEPLYFFCPQSDGVAPSSLVSPNCIAVAETDIRLEQLAAVTFNTYMNLTRWIMNMQHSVLDGEGVQALIDISEDLLGNTITVTDPALKLLAYSHKYLPTDDVNMYLISNGRHSDKVMDKFRQYNEVQETDDKNDIRIGRDFYTSKFIIVQKAHKYHGLLSASVTMVCNYRDVSDGLLDIFRIFNSYIALYTKRGYPYSGKYSAFDSLVDTLLNCDANNPEEAERKAISAGIATDGFFDLYKMDLLDKSAQSPAYVALSLSRNIPDSHVTLYSGAIIVLNILTGPDTSSQRLKDNIEIIKANTSGSVRAIGVSNSFRRLTAFRCAYKQAEAALSTLDVHATTLPLGDFPVREFEDCYLQSILLTAGGNESDGIYDNTVAAKAVRAIDKHDKDNNTVYLQLLETWLLCERRATDTGARLHLHRNTVIYHITKIDELFHLNFDDPMFRIKLLAEIARHNMEKSDNL